MRPTATRGPIRGGVSTVVKVKESQSPTVCAGSAHRVMCRLHLRLLPLSTFHFNTPVVHPGGPSWLFVCGWSHFREQHELQN